MTVLQPEAAELIRIRGLVQGVGFRPTVWRLASRYGLRGWVSNDGGGVIVSVCGRAGDIENFVDELRRTPPPLARIEAIERTPAGTAVHEGVFRIAESGAGETRTGVVPDAAICPACRAEILDPDARRYRYPFANCTHCGPRLSIIEAMPYDRVNTTMRAFRTCPACMAEYADPADRRFHAQPIACPDCGPRVWLEPPIAGEPVDVARRLLLDGQILAVKALGGFHLACDATDAAAVARLRATKRRDAKPFALMARDFSVIRRYAMLTAEAEAVLQSAAAPIVVLDAVEPDRLPGVAPGLNTLGFMLPATPLHYLLLHDIDRPLVMTSGNESADPPVIDDREAKRRLSAISRYALMHDREIANRVDDSVVRVMRGRSRVFRRSRGFAPAPTKLPAGFEHAPELLAMGGELKATFCLVKDGQAILSQHQGDLENAATFDDYRKNLALYRRLFDHAPVALVTDRHPEYLSTKLARAVARRDGLPLLEVQHHHAHVAACLAENGRTLNAPRVLGIVLDGLGYGEDGTIWGGEFLLADYRHYSRLARLKPVVMPGGAQAVREPWRSLYAHIIAAIGWSSFATSFAASELHEYLETKPLGLIDRMIDKRINSPRASSCGRLFDAVAAALGLCRERQAYEGEAAARLEAVAGSAELHERSYHFAVRQCEISGLIEIDPAPLWESLLRDVASGTRPPVVAARFHDSLARAIVDTAKTLARRPGEEPRFDAIAVSGGCFQNRTLFETVTAELAQAGFEVLCHTDIPANDGGLSLGQAAVAAARLLGGIGCAT